MVEEGKELPTERSLDSIERREIESSKGERLSLIAM